MAQRTNRLDRLQIPAPCPADWDRMRGDEQIRYCDECDKYVYNLSSMTRDQAESIVATAKGSLCVRLRREADGTIWTADRAAGLQLISRRASPIAIALVTAMMSISAVAQPPTLASEPVSGYSESGVKKPGAQAQADDGFATLWGTVVDPNEAVIPDAKLTLTNVSTGEVQTGTSSDEGTCRFILLKAGAYTLTIEQTGFSTVFLNEITLRGNETHQFSATMEPTSTLEWLPGDMAIPEVPLRKLYTGSDRIAVARVGETVEARSEDTRSLMITTLNVSSTIKGEGKRSKVYLYHWEYQVEKQDRYERGDNLLVFLKKREGEKGRKGKDAYEIDDPTYGVKKLSEADLGTYLHHIKELAAILHQDKPQAEEIVEWLVRCAEDPATRWEGASELTKSAARLLERAESASDTDDQKNEPAAESTAGAASPENVSRQAIEDQPGGNDAGFDTRLASYLTAQQKERLATALFSIESLVEGDFSLVYLVNNFGDSRLVPFLISQLRRAESNPTFIAGRIAFVMGDVLKDEEISDAAVEFTGKIISEEEANKDADESDQDQPRVKEPATVTPSQQLIASLREFISLVEKKMSAQHATPLPR